MVDELFKNIPFKRAGGLAWFFSAIAALIFGIVLTFAWMESKSDLTPLLPIYGGILIAIVGGPPASAAIGKRLQAKQTQELEEVKAEIKGATGEIQQAAQVAAVPGLAFEAIQKALLEVNTKVTELQQEVQRLKKENIELKAKNVRLTAAFEAVIARNPGYDNDRTD